MSVEYDFKDLHEQPLFFQSGHAELFGVLHSPKSENIHHGFVFCHPFAEEKLWSHRVFVSFARLLANKGYTVLRFDYFGHGDSDGEFYESTIETRLKNIASALEYLWSTSANLRKMSLLGLRFGATLAAIAAAQEKQIDNLVLWEPIVNGANYMQEILRTNLTTQLATQGKVTTTREQLISIMQSGEFVNIDGYELSYELYRQGGEISLSSYASSYEGNTLIIQTGKQGQPLRKELQELASAFKKCDLKQSPEEPFWREIKKNYYFAPNLTECTLEWLRERQ